MENLKGVERRRSWPNVKLHLPGGTEENYGNLNQDYRSLGRDLNPGPPEYQAGVLTIRRGRSVP
jgi:hypothetical protein